MTEIPIEFDYRGKHYKGHLGEVSGAGTEPGKSWQSKTSPAGFEPIILHIVSATFCSIVLVSTPINFTVGFAGIFIKGQSAVLSFHLTRF